MDLAGFQWGGTNGWAQNQLVQVDSTRKHVDIIRKHGWDLTLGHLSSLKTQWVEQWFLWTVIQEESSLQKYGKKGSNIGKEKMQNI